MFVPIGYSNYDPCKDVDETEYPLRGQWHNGTSTNVGLNLAAVYSYFPDPECSRVDTAAERDPVHVGYYLSNDHA